MSEVLPDCNHDWVPWPEAEVERYRALGYWQGESLAAMLARRAKKTPQALALVCGDRRWTYAVLQERVDAAAAGFLAHGLRRYDKVVVQLPNIAEFYVVCFALFRLGVIPVLALPAHRRSEVEHFCLLSGACAVVVADVVDGFDYRVLVRDVCRLIPALQKVFVVGQGEEFVAFDSVMTVGQAAPYWLESAAPLPAAGEMAFLQLSGGSTGLPKLIPRTHDDYLYSVCTSAALCGLHERSVYLCALPVAHNFPLSSPGAFGVFHAGGCVVLAPRPSPEVCFPLLQREQVTITAVVPPLALLWIESARQQRSQFPALAVLQVGGARFSEEAARQVRPVLGCTLQQVFGMAEGLVNYTRLDDDDWHLCNTQGRPMSPDDEVRVVDDNDQDVVPGEAGHLLTRGPYTIRGYFRAAAHNARAFTADGFYRTGDIVRQLPGGYLVVSGRDKDQINRGGEKIAAEEVENHLLAHPAVHDAALVAMPDHWLGEKSCAFIVAHGTLPRAIVLRQFLRERGLADFKMPDRFEFVDQMPLTRVGKIDKRALRERIAALLPA